MENLSNYKKIDSQVVLALVCCYGYFENRNDLEMQGLENYFNQVIQSLNKSDILACVFCGGITLFEKNENATITSESQSTLEWLEKSNLIINKKIPVIAENLAKNTPEHLVFGLIAASKIWTKINKVQVYCDKVRQKRVEKLLKILLEDKVLEFEVVAFDRLDNHPNSTEDIQNGAKMISDDKIKMLPLKVLFDSLWLAENEMFST